MIAVNRPQQPSSSCAPECLESTASQADRPDAGTQLWNAVSTDAESTRQQGQEAMMRRSALAGIAVGALLVSGCSPSQFLNTGGDTKCKDFITQDQRKQNQEVTKMLKDNSGIEPTNLEVAASRLSASTYCQTLGKPDTTISQAPHG